MALCIASLRCVVNHPMCWTIDDHNADMFNPGNIMSQVGQAERGRELIKEMELNGVRCKL